MNKTSKLSLVVVGLLVIGLSVTASELGGGKHILDGKEVIIKHIDYVTPKEVDAQVLELQNKMQELMAQADVNVGACIQSCEDYCRTEQDDKLQYYSDEIKALEESKR
jgi:hypothetical protein